MTPNRLGLDTANRNFGFEPIPAGTQAVLVMKISPGNIGLEGLLKPSSNDKSEALDCEFTVLGGEYDGRKVFDWMTLDGKETGHATAGEFSRAKLRAILEAVNGIDPNDNSPATISRRASASLTAFNGATFLAELAIERGGKKSNGGAYPDKNKIGRILRLGDQGYRKLEQPPPAPIERSTPSAAAPSGANGAPATAPTAIAKPDWSQ